MKDYKILDNYLDEEKIYVGQNYTLYKVYKESAQGELLNEECFFIKIWLKSEPEQHLIKELWMDEIRQLQVLKNFPSSANHLLVINNAHSDEESYSIVYNCDESDTLLSIYLDQLDQSSQREQRRSWIHTNNLINHKNRTKLWENILNIAYGVAILHQNGLLHRKISVENIVIRKEDSICNFKLTGFEWLLSVNTLKTSFRIPESDEPTIISSYNEDWYHLGKVVQFLLGGRNHKDTNLKNFDFLINREQVFLTKLENIYAKKSGNYVDKFITSEDVIKDIKAIIFSLKNECDDQENMVKTYDITINNQKILEMMQVVTEHLSLKEDILIEDFTSFISNDLDLNKITILKCLNKDKEIYCLQGRDLFYEIGPAKIRGTNILGWHNIVIIRRVFKKLNEWRGYSKQTKDFQIKLNFVSSSNSTNYWNNLIDEFKDDKGLSEDVKSFINTMLICYSIEVADYWANVFKASINVDSRDLSNDEGQIILTVDHLQNLENNKYAAILNKPVSSLNFKALATELDEKEWILSTKMPTAKEDFHASPDIKLVPFSSKDFKVIITFKSYNSRLAKYYFIVKVDSKNPNGLKNIAKYIDKNILYIYPKSLLANYAALIRRNYTLSQVAKNEALVTSIMHMETSTTKLKYPHSYINNYNELDKSKRGIYQEILDTSPNYIVQGPPGVGKTFLVTSLLEQIFHDEPDSKVVLSAQSHSTVQVLYDEIKKCKFQNDLTILDTFNNSEDETEDTIDIKMYEKHTKELWHKIQQSEMWKTTSKYPDLLDEIKKTTNSMFLRKSLYKHVLSSANIILATSNSATIESLNRNHNQFDWTILEESGKASGLELLSPLLLSSKRLLIGDHKQLPPFSEKSVNDILVGPNFDVPLLIDIISKGPFSSQLTKVSSLGNFAEASAFVRANLDDESEDFINFFTKVYHPIIDDISKYFSLFKTLVDNVERYKQGKSKRQMGDIITEQYRMHPDISRIVSNLFYKNELTNNPENEKKYLDISNRPFKHSQRNDLPNLNQKGGFVWLDISDPNHSTETKVLERHYSNEAEIDIIRRILDSLEVVITKDSKSPSIIILTPYKNQVNKIREMIKEENLAQSLQQKGFRCSADICKTVDSFQGGEADLVVVSLVRHNISKTSKRALGFLLDERRMNVMLSRAKYQMIVVGSIGMFEYWAYRAPEKKLDIVKEYQFVDKLCKWVAGVKINDNEINCEHIVNKINVTPYIQDFFQN